MVKFLLRQDSTLAFLKNHSKQTPWQELKAQKSDSNWQRPELETAAGQIRELLKAVRMKGEGGNPQKLAELLQ